MKRVIGFGMVAPLLASLLLSPDEAVGGDAMAPVDPAVEGGSFLDEDLSNVDTSMPLVKDGIYKLLAKKVEKARTKDATGELLKITLALEADNVTDVTGSSVAKGFPLFDQISITPSDKYTPDMIKKKVAAFVQAAGMQKIYPLDQYIDKGVLVYAKVGIQPERVDKVSGETYAARNVIKQYIKPGDIKG